MAFARINYLSRSLQKASSVSVVFPDDPAIPRPWSVFYLLHGLSDDDTIWMRRTSIERYVEGLPLVVVMPDGGRGWYTNAVIGYAYEDDLIKDIVGLIDRTFPVKAERSGRAIGGLSMGGYGAVKIGLKHHEMFASVNSHSGRWRSSESPSTPTTSGTSAPSSRGSSARPPRGASRTPSAIVEKLDHGRIPALRIDCGKGDFLIEQNRAFHRPSGIDAYRPRVRRIRRRTQLGILGPARPGSIAFHVRNLKIKK